ncbi:hypothetical protein AB1L30_06390 [Bremerella sp. JC817]|uniref:hypothetical protein n=1 Tax=Bremerella sp. JC817 TaxID=3231756 RepID=UPI00345B240D
MPQQITPPPADSTKAVKWEAGYAPEPVFIGTCNNVAGKEIFLLGVRFDNDKRLTDPSSGFFLHFLIVDPSDSKTKMHRLFQQRNVAYSESGVPGDTLSVKEVDKSERQKISLPKRHERAVRWPLFDGNPMQFLAQFYLPNTATTKKYLSWDDTVFLFQAIKDDEPIYAATMHDIGQQTAEDHYAAER